jgi:hypothetical protein
MALQTSTYKALIFTTLLSTAVVYLGFIVHIKKQSKLVAETYYELEPETITEEEKEELEDILKSLDNLLSTTPSTNKAYNETQEYENEQLNDQEFEEQMDAIKNRSTVEDIKAANQENSTLTASRSKSDDDKSSSFSNINDIVNKRSENQKEQTSANKNSSISYSLVDRTHRYLPTPIYLCEQGGKIVINITVDSGGNVTDAYYNNASTSDNGCLIDHAMEYAKAAKFNGDAVKASQLGSITFHFKGKQ